MSRRLFSQSNHFWRQLRFASTTVKEKPNPPPGIFGLYFRENWDEFRSKNVYLKQSELIRLIGDQWKELSAVEKDAYRDKYLEKVEEYKQQMISFEDSLNDEDRIVLMLKEEYKQTAQAEQGPLRAPVEFPKRPVTAFAHFLKAARESFPKSTSQTMGEWNESMAQKWRDMNEDEKRTFREASKKSYMKFAMEKDDKETFSLDEVGGFQR